MKTLIGIPDKRRTRAESGDTRQPGFGRPPGHAGGHEPRTARALGMGSLLLMLLVVIGCSPSQATDVEATDAGTVDAATAQLAPDGRDLSAMAYCARAAVAICDRAYSCGASTGQVRAKLGYENKAECREELSQKFERLCRPGAVSIKMDRATYDPSAAKSCLDTLETATCSTLSGELDGFGRGIFEPGICEDFIEPRQALGDACLSGNECQGSEVYCDGYAFTGNSVELGEDWTTLGQCSVLHQEGDSCSPGTESDCADGLFCNNSGTCKRIPAEGESCTAPWYVCADGLSCNQGICGLKAE